VRLVTITLLGLVLVTACAPSQSTFVTAAYRFAEAEKSVLLIDVPTEIRVVTPRPTTVESAEINLETTFAPIDLAALPDAWGQPLIRTLRLYRNTPIRGGGAAVPWVHRLTADPRRDGQRGYRLLLPYREAPRHRNQLTVKPPDESALDDARARFCLVRAETPLDNLPRPHWYAFEPEKVAAHFDVRMLLLVAIESITVVDTGSRPRVSARLGTHLIDLRDPLLAADFVQDIDLTRPDGPAGGDAATCLNVAELRADNWQPLRASLATLGERYGYFVAMQLGWIGADRLIEEAQRWQTKE
jgi:hypothetical protein